MGAQPQSAEPLCGVANIDKPTGMTSRQAVDVVKRLVYPARIGHAGTLDPLATGVLVVCIGAATRLIDYVQRAPKRYRGTFLLGLGASPTEDVEGEITLLPDPPRPTADQIVTAARTLTGEIQQRPPAFSALHVGGKRSYELARAGKEVILAARPITVHAIDLIAYEYPELTLDIRCGSGTYVRSLGRDLAESLGTAAVMAALVRTEIGQFRVEGAWSCERLRGASRAEWLLPPTAAVRGLPTVTVSAEESEKISCGQFLEIAPPGGAEQTELAALDAAGQLVAVLKPRGGGMYGAKVNMAPRN